MKNSIRITFLYAEITTYLFGCLKYLAKNFPEYSVEVVYLNKRVNVKLNELQDNLVFLLSIFLIILNPLLN